MRKKKWQTDLVLSRFVVILLAVVLSVSLVPGSILQAEGKNDDPGNKSSKTEITKIADLEGKKVASRTGTAFAGELDKVVNNVEHLFLEDIPSQLQAVESGKADAALLDEPVARLGVAQHPNLTILDEKLAVDSYGLAFKKGDPLADEVSSAIKKFSEDGTLEEMAKKWFGADETKKTLPELTYKSDFDGSKGIIRYGYDTVTVPMSYIGDDGQARGYDVELTMRIAYELNMELKMTPMEFSALLMSLESGKSNMVGGCISITEERKESVDFSEPYYRGGMVVVVNKENTPGGASGEDEKSWSQSLKESFTKTFITEDRYKLILKGLQTTLLISLLSLVFGTMLGFMICMMRRSRIPFLRIPAKVFIRLVQGIPIVVILMILFYLVFTSPDMSGVLVAVIGFSINFAAYVSEMMRTGIDAVDRGQLEAASAIGFNRIQVFCLITMPQAARHVLPVFKGEFISMIKMTSVVGYITVQDLAKMGDIIRSRTFEAFFPLIVTAIIYFVISYLLTFLLTVVEQKIDPKHRKRIVRGVNAR